MIILFGAPGTGKSLQGQILAARYGWRWLSVGQMLRDLKDPKAKKQMEKGELVDDNFTNQVVARALASADDIDHVILDGYPRELVQAKWLVENQPHIGRSIELVMVLDVPVGEILKRLKLRGRPDDDPKPARERQEIYESNSRAVTQYFEEQNIPVVHVSGSGTVADVMNRIESELKAWQLL